MLIIPYFAGVSGLSSIFTLAIVILSELSSLDSSSRMGDICLHGPHHSAQKSHNTRLLLFKTSHQILYHLQLICSFHS